MKSRKPHRPFGKRLSKPYLAVALVLAAIALPSLMVAQQAETPAQAQPTASKQAAGNVEPSHSTSLEFKTNAPFPNLLGPYSSPSVPGPHLNNSGRLRTLIQSGKLELSLEDAIDLVVREGEASASLIQRRLGIGYPRAAQLLDMLSELGVVGSLKDGGRAREVLMKPGQDTYKKLMERRRKG